MSQKIILRACFSILLLSVSASAQPAPQSPQDFLGFRVGADRKLADWQQINDYFTQLARSSPRVQLEVVGPTSNGNPFLLATISSPETLAQLQEYQRIQEMLADPRRVNEAGLGALIRNGKTVVLITCAIHSTEVASAQMSMEFAWDMATADDPETEEILNNVIFLFVPSLNPDGVNIVNHWYQETVGTPAEGTSPPELYHPYVGHDNNRDWYMFTQKETRLAVEKVHNRWHPQIVYDVHQMGSRAARIFVPPFIDPYEQNVDPILQAEIVDLGGFMFSRLVGAGKKGVVTQAIYDAFTPARAYQHYHAGVRILSESASVRIATPVEISFDQLGPGRNYDARTPSWNFPEPWKGGSWHLRDIVDYQKIALKACLLHAARNREIWLTNFHRVGERALERESPYAFVIPAADLQRDTQGLFDLLNVLETGLVEIDRATAPFRVSGLKDVSPPWNQQISEDFAAGTYIVRVQQPYGSFAKSMLEIQHYPELRETPGGPLKRPYDVTAHTLGIQLGVSVYRSDRPFEANSERVTGIAPGDGRLSGSGRYWLFSHSNNAFAHLSNRLLAHGVSLFWAPNGFRQEGVGFPVGTVLASVPEGLDTVELLRGLPLEVTRVSRQPQLAWKRVTAPRIGIYQSYNASMDEGWTRWILEEYEFPYQRLVNQRIRNGNLKSEFDVILVPDQGARAIKNGLSSPYPEQFVGGIGDAGMEALRDFAKAGGTVLLLGQASQLAAELGLSVRNELEGLSNRDFFVPGSLLRARTNPQHPLTFGLPAEIALMFVRSQAFSFESGISLLDYPGQDLLLSGWIDGEARLVNRSAMAELPLGDGRVILIGFRSQFRAQARATYKLLFNSLYYSTMQ